MLSGGEREKKGTCNPNMSKRKCSVESYSASKRRVTTKTTTRKVRAKDDCKVVAGMASAFGTTDIIHVSAKGITPIKRHVVARDVPPSPFDLNLVPRTTSINLVEKKFKLFAQEDAINLKR